jgi:hypothetical protein
MRFSTSSLFHESVSSRPLSIPSGHFRNIRGDIPNFISMTPEPAVNCVNYTSNILLLVPMLPMINYCRCC